MANEDVAAFLGAHQADAAFVKICSLARAAFPESATLDVMLQEDPDDLGRLQVVLLVMLPSSTTDDDVQAALAQYHKRLVMEVPLSVCPLFAVVPEFAPE